MNKSAEISKDGRTLTVNTFKDLKHFLDRVRYKHFQITVDKPIKELIIKDSKTDLTVNYVTKILRNAALQTIESFEIISPDNRFCTIDGLLYSGSGENLYLCPKGKEGTLIIPDGTKMIFVEACRNCKFDKVVLPDSVEIIDKYAFSRSWNLKEVEGGKNVERIRDYAFFGCINLKHFTFHARLRGIGGDAFNNTSMSEINLPEGLRTIGPGAFNTVGTSKGFASCAGQSDMYEMFSSCQMLTDLDTSSFDTSRVKNMQQMFYDCNKLVNLNMSSFDTSNVTNMNKMWYNCRSLTRLDLSNFDTSKVTGMNYSFYACHGMNTLILGEKFAFVGSTYSIPLSSWRNSSGETFDSDGTMSNIPSNVADVYSKM